MLNIMYSADLLPLKGNLCRATIVLQAFSEVKLAHNNNAFDKYMHQYKAGETS